MNGSGISGDQHIFQDALAAKLTDAAYAVALRHDRPGSWIDLELELWKVLSETIQTWLPAVQREDKPVSVSW